jgi:acyl-CoA thioesterase YciA
MRTKKTRNRTTPQSIKGKLTTAADTRQPAIRVILLPRDTNKHGTIFGGIILSYIDLAAAAEVGRHTTQKAVTVSIKEVVFKQPVLVGELASFYAQVTRIGRTSISVHIDVEVDRNGKTVPVTQADLTYVCLDKQDKPTPVKLIKRKAKA